MMNATMKRIIALVLALSMALSLASVSAFAAESEIVIDDASQVEAVESEMDTEAEIQEDDINELKDPEEESTEATEETVETETVETEDGSAETAETGEVSAESAQVVEEETEVESQAEPETAVADDKTEDDTLDTATDSWTSSPYIDEDASFSFPCGDNLIANVYKLSDKSWKMVVSGTGGMYDEGDLGSTNGFWSNGAGRILVDGEVVGSSPIFDEFFDAIYIEDENYSAAENGTTVELIFNEGVTSIGTYAFSSCGGLTSVQFPSTMESIGECAFALARNLTGTLVIPEGVKTVDAEAFSDIAITSLVVDSDAKLGVHSFADLYELQNIDINGNATIGDRAFTHIDAAKKITITGNATIERSGMVSCSSLTDLVITGKCVLKSSSIVSAPKLTNVSISKNSTVAADAFNETKYENTIAKNIAATKPASFSASNKAGQKIAVKWKAVSYGQKYQVQYSTSKSFKNAKTKTVTKNSATISNLTKNKKYYVRVRAVFYNSFQEKTVYSKWSAVKNVTTINENAVAKKITATKPASLSVSNKKTKKMTAKWKAINYSQKYQVQYSTSKSFKNAKTKTVTKNSATISNLTKNKKYYIRVRAVFYNSFKGKTVYSKWSAVKNVTIKK